MSAKHTPGPWTAAEHHGAIDVMGVGSGVCRVFTDPNQNSLPTMPGARANARLIAAAPTMLEALRGMLAWHDAPPAPGSTAWHDALKAANDAARAAIAKAEGGPK